MSRPILTPEDVALVTAAAWLDWIEAQFHCGRLFLHWADASRNDQIVFLTFAARRLGYAV